MDTGSTSNNVQPLPTLDCLELRTHPQRGRGVFTREPIPKGTLVHISPVLLFGAEEYSRHGKFTQLDHYTYCWKGGCFALALGLGSMFNHEPFGQENIGFVRDMHNEFIKYTALRDIAAGEELCICYGPNVWFDVITEVANKNSSAQQQRQSMSEKAEEDDNGTNFLRCFDL
ncbi:hypothetical protein GGI25_001595 [Coemansia spiralis]|uniref:SET domain-containing protein n=2 Tax=Coemansia TaxID=4863 RepID=A0A9W8GA68_9FUNG|nr:hypothetical protein BX070DRAFT_230154 [Coemansia spiralis]KAJ1991614.1 hypothetical protein EDC05_003379 [Coemansia umbellata]KAJ2623974.1 hypothetical protein GGI26_001989 [Coemansia sp. RSA 1358]KAJ2679239.1 hypothetical protein GGI25_001595 [Coemansia spiralis]